MPTVTVSTTQDVKIAPQAKAKLMKALRTFAQLAEQRKAIDLAMAKQKAIADDVRADTGQQTLAIEGFKVSEVAGTRKKFNKKSFVANGGDLAIYNDSFDEVPVKAYCKITLPGEKEEKGDDE